MIGIEYPEAKKFARQIARNESCWMRETPAQVKRRIAAYAPTGEEGSEKKLTELKQMYRGNRASRQKALRLLLGDEYDRMNEEFDRRLAETSAELYGCAY